MSEYKHADEFPMQQIFAYLSTNLRVKTSIETVSTDESNRFVVVTQLYLIEPKTGEEKLIARG